MYPFSHSVGVPLKEPPDKYGIKYRQAEDSSEPKCGQRVWHDLPAMKHNKKEACQQGEMHEIECVGNLGHSSRESPIEGVV